MNFWPDIFHETFHKIFRKKFTMFLRKVSIVSQYVKEIKESTVVMRENNLL